MEKLFAPELAVVKLNPGPELNIHQILADPVLTRATIFFCIKKLVGPCDLESTITDFIRGQKVKTTLAELREDVYFWKNEIAQQFDFKRTKKTLVNANDSIAFVPKQKERECVHTKMFIEIGSALATLGSLSSAKYHYSARTFERGVLFFLDDILDEMEKSFLRYSGGTPRFALRNIPPCSDCDRIKIMNRCHLYACLDPIYSKKAKPIAPFLFNALCFDSVQSLAFHVMFKRIFKTTFLPTQPIPIGRICLSIVNSDIWPILKFYDNFDQTKTAIAKTIMASVSQFGYERLDGPTRKAIALVLQRLENSQDDKWCQYSDCIIDAPAYIFRGQELKLSSLCVCRIPNLHHSMIRDNLLFHCCYGSYFSFCDFS